MVNNLVPNGRSRRGFLKMASACSFKTCFLVGSLAVSAASGQTSSPVTVSSQLPANWRDIKDGVGGYPAGPMLEIALRRTHSDKLEMFKWRSEFIAMLSAQPGPLVEREWHSTWGLPANTGAGTWTGMTWWENQQKWQDMANVLFSTPVAEKWLQTLDMTLVFVKPLDKSFDLHTLAQSSGQVLELGLLAFPAFDGNAATGNDPAAAQTYLDALKKNGAETYRFAIYPNMTGTNGPYTVAYNKNSPPDKYGEQWYVYMASYESAETRIRLQATDEVRRAFEELTNSMVKGHSDIQVMERSTSQVCIKKSTHACSLDPDDCHVGLMGSGDTWAASCSERPQPCMTDYNVCSQISPRTCDALGGKRAESCSQTTHP
ncbi:hypothetical protein D3273_26280 [Lichenibacterium minor]|uniref:Uncharacterized protein n=1 Tax=Lichenibacterium minor TaxID=2316528 RepID=A0A4V1RTV8_9HYPH|nr:hypothetical protein [Lichenibacterium minor]RYC29004.1 hypothetical protein D3273_26280 [Lichenibacterium minor]